MNWESKYERAHSMRHLTRSAYFELVRFDYFLIRGRFERLYDLVRNYPVHPTPVREISVAQLCSAVDTASIWYFKRVLCLQRSAATTCLLRKNGISAQMVLGAQQIPFRAHAWVEVDGHVVNDKPYIPELYSVLDRC
jgi:Transglutaminase-like superfamily